MCSLRSRPLKAAVLWLAALSVFWGLDRAQAISGLSFAMQKLEAEGWRAEQLRFTLGWSNGKPSYRLEVRRLVLTPLELTLEDVSFECFEGRLSDQQIGCSRGRLHLPLAQLDRPDMDLSFIREQSGGRLEASLRNVFLAGGRAQADLTLQGGEWQALVKGQRLDLEALLALLPPERRPPEGWSHDARLQIHSRLAGKGVALHRADWRLDIAQLAFSDATGGFAGEGLGAHLQGELETAGSGWRGQGQLSLTEGELLTPAFYLDPGTHSLRLETSFSSDQGMQEILLDQTRLELEGLVSLRAGGRLVPAADRPLQYLRLQVDPFQVGAVYTELLQPVLAGTPWGQFELEGETELTLNLDGDVAALALGLQDFHLDDAKKPGTPRRMGLYGVDGRIYWDRGAGPRPSWLTWQAGHLLEKLDLGAGRIDFQTYERDFRLIRQARLPVVDGALVVDRLEVSNLGEEDQQLAFDGMLEPISMQALSQALGWPPLSGKLSGVIPGLTYRAGQFKLDGNLLVRMFEGDILIRRLRLQDLFGVYPQLQADIELKQLDLETLTRTFSFGRITGRLDGHVRGLQLEAWRPVAFDALFHTPKDDDSPHRISQKAVDNISNLGGAGLSGSLARSFLGVFEEFRYKRIGIGCRLRGGTCEMVGVGPAKQGYYLVEGSGIPRIDIIGYNRTADWSRLVEQLKQITESGGPVVQ
jgi:hypothetical protein